MVNKALSCGYKGEPHMYYDLNLVASDSHFIHISSVPLTVLERVVGASIMDIGEQGDTHLTTCTRKRRQSFP